eukprot:SAG31_NODE_95_length_25901_cov_24.763700_22_plen_158_part_00
MQCLSEERLIADGCTAALECGQVIGDCARGAADESAARGDSLLARRHAYATPRRAAPPGSIIICMVWRYCGAQLNLVRTASFTKLSTKFSSRTPSDGRVPVRTYLRCTGTRVHLGTVAASPCPSTRPAVMSRPTNVKYKSGRRAQASTSEVVPKIHC